MLEKHDLSDEFLEVYDQEILNKIIHWKKKEIDFSFSIFSFEMNSEDDLANEYIKLNDVIATYFQSKLEKNIEIWNIYIFFFLKGKVSKDIKYEVEQNKYCSRKIVFDDLSEVNIDENLIENYIIDRLFKINIKKLNIDILSDKTLFSKIFYDTNFKDLFSKFLDEKKNMRKSMIEKYIKGDI